MKFITQTLFFVLLCISCKTQNQLKSNNNEELVIAFGSCNKQYVKNVLWDEVLKNKPKVWIWGGDNIYSDTDNKEKLKADYKQQLENPQYQQLLKSTKVLGTWDDHDYGLNDGGEEFHFKQESQQLFLDFMGVSKLDPRRTQQGVYYSEDIITKDGIVKVLVLDTRYFRTKLTSSNTNKRYQPNAYGVGTLLGAQQWTWLQEELTNSKADFNLIVSSIQFLSYEHGFETWGNFPHEVDKLIQIIQESNAKGIIILSGDRHISEFSKTSIKNRHYPLIDFTSSGLTHTYSDFKEEANRFRYGDVVSDISFGILKFNFKTHTVTMQMRGVNNKLQQELIQSY